MAEINCPWCEAELPLATDDAVEEQACPECLTSWRYEPAGEEVLPLAA